MDWKILLLPWYSLRFNELNMLTISNIKKANSLNQFNVKINWIIMKRWNVYYWEWPENDNDSIWIWWDCSWFLTNIQCEETYEIILIQRIKLKIHVIIINFCFFRQKNDRKYFSNWITVWSYLIQVSFYSYQ